MGFATSYLLISGLVAADALAPVSPGETAVLTGAAMAVHGMLSLAGVGVAAAVGAFAGDLLAYRLGRSLDGRLARWLSGRLARSVDRGIGWVGRRGAPVLIAARFVPGGRTAATVAAGAAGMPFRRFAPAAACGGILWSAYLLVLGYAGGTLLHLPPIAVGLAVSALAAAVALAARRRRAPAPEDGRVLVRAG